MLIPIVSQFPATTDVGEGYDYTTVQQAQIVAVEFDIETLVIRSVPDE